MTLTLFLSRILGFVRDIAIAHRFGSSFETDAFLSAMNIPDILYFLISGGAISTTLIPIFTDYLEKNQEGEAWKLFNIVSTYAFAIMAGLVLIGEVFAETIVRLSFGRMPEHTLALTISLTRILLPQALCMVLGGVLMGALYSYRKFYIPAIGPLIYNLGIILGAWFLGAMPQFGVNGLAYGLLAGAIIGPLLLPAVALRRMGIPFQPSLDYRHPGVKRVLILMLPVIFGLSFTQLFPLISRYFLQSVESEISNLNYAYRIMQAPVGIFGQAIAVALYPTISALAASGKMAEFAARISGGARAILFLAVPSTVLLIACRGLILRTFFQHGEFTAQNSDQVAPIIVFFSLGMFAHAVQGMLTRGFYALHDTISPVIAGTVGTVVFVLISILFTQDWAWPLGARGMALATTLSVLFNVAVLAIWLRRRCEDLRLLPLVLSFCKMTLAAMAMFAVCSRLQSALPESSNFGGGVLQLLIQLLCGGLTYGLSARLLQVEELATVTHMLLRRLPRAASD
jgi:putative peptidoglycan lipid II flippase